MEEKGIVRSLKMSGVSGTVAIKADRVLEGTKTGDSIAVNGICLTVTSVGRDGFTADVMAETVRRSSLGTCTAGTYVNLERALSADGRFGGHIVSGHIDGTGRIESLKKEGNAVWITVCAAQEILRLIVEKGSICIDGISLTVADVSDREFRVSVIPHTGAETTLLHKLPGDLVNLENDIVGKYVERLLGTAVAAASSGPERVNSPGQRPAEKTGSESAGKSCRDHVKKTEPGITMDMLNEYGF